MKKYLFIFSALAFAGCSSSKQASMSSTNESKALDGGWITLFDGSSTSNWHTYGKTSAGKVWKIDNGTLHLDPVAQKNMKGEAGDLVTNEEYENFDLKLEWKISPKGNSGILFYVNEDPAKYHETYFTGPEMQVLDNGTPTVAGHPDGRLYTHRAGDLYDLLASKEAVKTAGEWNQVEVISNKGKLDFYMNGQHSLSTTMWNDNWRQMIAISKFKDMTGFGTFKKGKIALQDHGDEVWFRNIKIKKL
jgi:hypothetical protein